VNRSVAECHQAGTVTSSTLMACSQAFADGVAMAKANPQLRIGCHAMLIDGEPLTEIDSLRGKGFSKAFRVGFPEFAQAAITNRLHADEITAEAVAQMRKIQAEGIEITHFDTHKHTHMFPKVLRPLLRAARECGVRAVRNPFAPIKALAIATLLRRPKLWVRYTEVRALRSFAGAFAREVEAAGMKTTSGTFGIIATGGLDQKLFDAIIGSIPEGTWEFVCHPGYNDTDLAKVLTRLHDSREKEMAVLPAIA
jgi:chitin disaccharide deacetylase